MPHPIPYEISDLMHDNEGLIRTAIVRQNARALVVTFFAPPTGKNETSKFRNATIWVQVKVDESLLNKDGSGGTTWSEVENEDRDDSKGSDLYEVVETIEEPEDEQEDQGEEEMIELRETTTGEGETPSASEAPTEPREDTNEIKGSEKRSNFPEGTALDNEYLVEENAENLATGDHGESQETEAAEVNVEANAVDEDHVEEDNYKEHEAVEFRGEGAEVGDEEEGSEVVGDDLDAMIEEEKIIGEEKSVDKDEKFESVEENLQHTQEKTKAQELHKPEYTEIEPGLFELHFFIKHGYPEKEIFSLESKEEEIPVIGEESEGEGALNFHEFSCTRAFHVGCSNATVTCEVEESEGEGKQPKQSKEVKCVKLVVSRTSMNNTSTDTNTTSNADSTVNNTEDAKAENATKEKTVTEFEEVFHCEGEDQVVETFTCTTAQVTCDFLESTCEGPVTDTISQGEENGEKTHQQTDDAEAPTNRTTVGVCPNFCLVSISCIDSSFAFTSDSQLLTTCTSFPKRSEETTNATTDEQTIEPKLEKGIKTSDEEKNSSTQGEEEIRADNATSTATVSNATIISLKIECKNSSEFLAPSSLSALSPCRSLSPSSDFFSGKNSSDRQLFVEENIDYYGESLKATNMMLNKAFGFECTFFFLKLIHTFFFLSPSSSMNYWTSFLPSTIEFQSSWSVRSFAINPFTCAFASSSLHLFAFTP